MFKLRRDPFDYVPIDHQPFTALVQRKNSRHRPLGTWSNGALHLNWYPSTFWQCARL